MNWLSSLIDMQHLNTSLRSWIFESPVRTHLKTLNLSAHKRPAENIFPLQKFFHLNFCIKIPYSTCLKDFTTIIHLSIVQLYHSLIIICRPLQSLSVNQHLLVSPVIIIYFLITVACHRQSEARSELYAEDCVAINDDIHTMT